LEPVRPLVWINELPWHELNVADELTCCCQDPFCRGVENSLRMTLYQWEHLRADMVVEAVYYAPLAISDSGFGIRQEGELLAQDARGGIHSQAFVPQIGELADVEKIRLPELHHDEQASERTHQRLNELMGDLLTIRPRGVVHTWFAPWDELIRWYGVQEALTDLALRPELVHAAMDRLVTAHLHRLEQWRALGLLDQTSGNYRVGSGGLGYTRELPLSEGERQVVDTTQQWGCATAQIFSEVSPAMHEEFALAYERRWLTQFGLVYYGCCEPLHHKLGILESVPNLRKVSMSPKANLAAGAERANGRYVLSHKPNPAIFTDQWSPERARDELVRALEPARGHPVEVIMKDVSTVQYQPQRLWEWAEIAREVVTSLDWTSRTAATA
ncbi:MAG: hypothetical protein HUU35_18340, partial [Armatimonadetes bacterium]|nr:hypothetical protein [Armatimonadota bacterium]